MVRMVRRRNGKYSIYRDGILVIDNLDFEVALFISQDLSDAEEELSCFIDDILSDYISAQVRKAFGELEDDKND